MMRMSFSFVCMIPIKIARTLIPTEQFTRNFFIPATKKQDVFKDKGVGIRLT